MGIIARVLTIAAGTALSLFFVVNLATGQSLPPTPGYVATPAGMIWSTCLHNVPNGSYVDIDSGVVLYSDGGFFLDAGPCPYPMVQFGDGGAISGGTTGGTGGTTGGSPSGLSGSGTGGGGLAPTCTYRGCSYIGWIQDVRWTAPSGKAICSVDGIVPVPDLPTTINGQGLIWFNGVEEIHGQMIIQPVLVFGTGSQGGYDDGWAIQAYWVDPSGNAFWYGTPDGAVSPGDEIVSHVYLEYKTIKGHSTLVYEAFLEDTTSTWWAALDIGTIDPYNDPFVQAIVSTEEAHWLWECSQLSSHSEGLTYSDDFVFYGDHYQLAAAGGCSQATYPTWTITQAGNEPSGSGDLPWCNWYTQVLPNSTYPATSSNPSALLWGW